ncbi:hypothetical protein VKT23_009151 [Stygiomarasmius scandens]|uniref:Uncharacterized protein n=1 Tax=Marasmiellus scandens TaxID=2682957 RepID=A0ABR1JF74_9AGAR
MESQYQHVHGSYPIRRTPAQNMGLFRYHPYKRISYISYSPPERNVNLFGEEVNRFLQAVQLVQRLHQQHDHQLPRHEQENQREDHGNEERVGDGNIDIAGVQPEPPVRQRGSTMRFLKYLFTVFFSVFIFIFVLRLFSA